MPLRFSESFFYAGERVGVAVSGGADSVTLLELLLRARDRLGIVVAVAHYNHRLRGDACLPLRGKHTFRAAGACRVSRLTASVITPAGTKTPAL